MGEQRFIVDEAGQGKRIDLYLTELLEDLTRSQLQRLIVEKKVLVNGRLVKANYKIKVGDIVTCQFPLRKAIRILPENIPLQIVYEDKDLLVINKPRGMLVHPARGKYTGTLVNALLYYCSELSGRKESIRPGIVHRLDKETSGLLVVAKNDYVHQDLVQQFKASLVRREYLALVYGVMSEPGGIIDAPIGRNLRNRQKMAVVLKNSKSAITKYQVLERFQDYTLLHCQLETGRTHQIRVHLAYLQHPVVGDFKYGTSISQQEQSRKLGLQGQALHAVSLGFKHPCSREWLEFSAIPPQDFVNALQVLGSDSINKLLSEEKGKGMWK
ncbi:MAG: RluA family pseudouridine synthase [Peptococcia bacterium]|jgi:23S rRNA pseudouridine1911/1915/1917 synthase